MYNKRKPPNRRLTIVESSSISKKTKPDVQEKKNVSGSKDKAVIEPKKPVIAEPKDKKTVTTVTDTKDKRIITDTKEKKILTILKDPKDRKSTGTKQKKTVTFAPDVKDKSVTDTEENKIVIELKEKIIMPISTEKKETVMRDIKKEILPAVMEIKDKVPVPEVKETKGVPALPEIKDKAVVIVPYIKETQPLIQVKEKVPVPEVEKKPVVELKEKPVVELKEKPVVELKEKPEPVVELKEKPKPVVELKEKPMVEKREDDETSSLARTIVDNAIASAVWFVEGSGPAGLPKELIVSLLQHHTPRQVNKFMLFTDARNPVKNIKWLSHGEFTAEKGRIQIEYFVSTWEFQNRWAYYVDFIERKDLIHSFYFIYHVCWSASTAVRPMARVSANAYFTIKFNKKSPPDLPVDVSYIFENSELLLR
ncbi:A-kinase anchor protein 14 [Nannospalax galili]|uniref:A-kinase anchor protein 14 n=1 Tax=Nannospalax galili TaxID=1026970 RepID=UPI00111BFB9D|nr:A-kinase anchor protein 14 [Nannospalax galili]